MTSIHQVGQNRSYNYSCCRLLYLRKKATSAEEAQIVLQKEQLRMELLKLKIQAVYDAADRKERQEKLDAEVEMNGRKHTLDQQSLTRRKNAENFLTLRFGKKKLSERDVKRKVESL